jgi:hypothetical protein
VGGSIMRRLEMKRPTRLVITSSPFREDLISPERGYAQPEEPDIDDQYDSREYEEVGYRELEHAYLAQHVYGGEGEDQQGSKLLCAPDITNSGRYDHAQLHRSDR